MEDDVKAYLAEILALTAETWKGLALAAGLSAGFFSELKRDVPVSATSLAQKKGYDLAKVRSWIRFGQSLGLVSIGDRGVSLTEKGFLLSPQSPYKDVVAFVEETVFFIQASAVADPAFRPEQSLDVLSEGQISKEYQAKVSDNLSVLLIGVLQSQNLSAGDSLLDVGCGNGNFLRELLKALPEMFFSGVDRNLFALEKAKKENLALGLTGRIKMIAGDIVEDLGQFPDRSQDWVTAINVLHFVPADQRDNLIQQLIRIARKGVFLNIVETETTLINTAANPLLHLLWNDFTGFCSPAEARSLLDHLTGGKETFKVSVVPILHGNSQLVTILKP